MAKPETSIYGEDGSLEVLIPSLFLQCVIPLLLFSPYLNDIIYDLTKRNDIIYSKKIVMFRAPIVACDSTSMTPYRFLRHL